LPLQWLLCPKADTILDDLRFCRSILSSSTCYKITKVPKTPERKKND
jgi:hypothetical protein